MYIERSMYIKGDNKHGWLSITIFVFELIIEDLTGIILVYSLYILFYYLGSLYVLTYNWALSLWDFL